MTPQDDILTISDIAEFFKVAEKTVYALAQKGQLPGFKVGGQWRFRRTAIDAWIDKRTPTEDLNPHEDPIAQRDPARGSRAITGNSLQDG